MALTQFERFAYAVGQGTRASLYYGQYWLAGRLTRPVRPGKDDPEGAAPMSGPSTRDVLSDLGDLFRRELSNIDAGYYRLPDDMLRQSWQALAGAPRFFGDLPAVERRRHARDGQEVFAQERRKAYPRYYQQNFHFQTDGWFSRDSARRYDHQVEILFAGGAELMRRQAMVPLYRAVAGRRSDALRLLDIGTGTGSLLETIKQNYPRLPVTGLDLSEPYLREAAERLSSYRRWALVQAAGEALPFGDGSLDVVTSVFLFHELPRKARDGVAAEIARVLKPGGTAILVDSLQLGDEPSYDPLLAHFPVAFHEPYYADYIRHDLTALFAGHGLRSLSVERAFFSRVMTFVKER